MADDQENQVTPNDVRSALDSVSDPDTLPAGSTQPTTTLEAQSEAKKILSRVGTHDTEATKLKQDIEDNAEASRQALKRAQKILLQNYSLTMPNDQELAERTAAAWMHPTQGGVYGAGIAQAGNVAAESAAQSAERREALTNYLRQASGLPLQESLSKVNTTSAAAREKILDMQSRYDAELGRGALSMLGRQLASPGAQAGLKPQSNFGKIALDQLGPAAFNNGVDASGGFSPAYRALVQKLNDTAIAEARARAGIDAHPPTPAERVMAANQAGVPAFPQGAQDPSRMSTQQQKQFFQDEEKAYAKRQDTMDQDDAQIQAALRSLDDFQMRNQRTYTGPSLTPWYLGGIHAGTHGAGADFSQDRGGINLNPISWMSNFKTDIQTMQKDAANVIPMAIPARGFGRVTNRDLGLFQSGMIGVDKDQATNNEIAQALRIRLTNDLERNKFLQSYFQNHRQLQGAELNWQDYLDNNPIFDPTVDTKKLKPGQVVPLNPHRMGWQEYFRKKNPQIEEEQGPPGTQEPDVSYHAQAADSMPAQATGGRVGMAEGGQPPPSEPDPEIQNGLNALLNGLTLRAAGRPEDPNSPGENFLGELAGGTATGLAGLAALRRPARAARFMAEHPHITASGLGAGAGGVSAEMGGTDPMVGAGAGAMAGPVLAGLSRGAFRGGNDVLDMLRHQVINGGTRKAIGALERDSGGDWDRIADQLQSDAKAKIPSTLGEFGPRSQGLTRAALGKDVPESNELLGDLQDRQASAPDRVADRVNTALAPDNYMLKAQELRDALYTKAKPLYDQAFSQFPAVKSDSLQQIMNTPSGQEAAARAFRMLQDKQVPLGTPDATGMVQHPSLQYLDQVKRALDDMIIREEGVGANYQATEQGRILRQMRSSLVNELDKATMGPQGQPSPYRAARDQYAGDLDVMDALRTGRENFDKLTPDEVRQLMQKLDYSSRDAFRTGVAEGIFQRLGNMRGHPNPAQVILGNQNLQQKVAAIFDQPAQAQKFLAAMERESEIYTSGQMLQKHGIRALIDSGAPGSAASMMRTQLMGKGTAGEVADTMSLTPNDPQAQDKLNHLRAQADRLRARGTAAGVAGGAGTVGLATAAAPNMLSQGQQ